MSNTESPLTCHRCSQQSVGVVSVAEFDEGRAASAPLMEVSLCVEHLAEVAEVLGFERPGELRVARGSAG
jgi:hypothetical protein